MSTEDNQPEELLVSQLGTENRILDRDQVDMEILTVIRDSRDNPDTLHAHNYFGLTERIRQAKNQNIVITFGEALAEASKRNNVAVGGLGRRQMIEGELARRGISKGQTKDMAKPTLYDKLVRRDVVKKWEEQEKEKIDVE